MLEEDVLTGAEVKVVKPHYKNTHDNTFVLFLLRPRLMEQQNVAAAAVHH